MRTLLILSLLLTLPLLSTEQAKQPIAQALQIIHRVSDVPQLATLINKSTNAASWKTIAQKRLANIKKQGAHLNHFTGALAQKSIKNLELLISLL